MVTPEGRVKQRLRNLLKGYSGVYLYWPVPSGYGRTTLDVLGCYRGKFFAVETKAEGKKPTLRQHTELEAIARAGGRVFVISGTESPVFGELRAWLDTLRHEPDDPIIPSDQVARRPV
jgi:hypothetical protein